MVRRLRAAGGRVPALFPTARDAPADKRRVVTNLVGNAVAHTPVGTPVRIGVGMVGTDAVPEISDAGPAG